MARDACFVTGKYEGKFSLGQFWSSVEKDEYGEEALFDEGLRRFPPDAPEVA
jgi:hypothetical protein